MTTRALKDVMLRAETWPEEAQQKLAEIASEIEAELNERRYHATARELDGIDRGIKAARDGRFVTDEDVEAVFAKHRQR
jgi:predicted transcriptional regulator